MYEVDVPRTRTVFATSDSHGGDHSLYTRNRGASSLWGQKTAATWLPPSSGRFSGEEWKGTIGDEDEESSSDNASQGGWGGSASTSAASRALERVAPHYAQHKGGDDRVLDEEEATLEYDEEDSSEQHPQTEEEEDLAGEEDLAADVAPEEESDGERPDDEEAEYEEMQPSEGPAEAVRPRGANRLEITEEQYGASYNAAAPGEEEEDEDEGEAGPPGTTGDYYFEQALSEAVGTENKRLDEDELARFHSILGPPEDREALARHDTAGYQEEPARYLTIEEEAPPPTAATAEAALAERLQPSTPEEIDQAIEVRYVEGKGRVERGSGVAGCAFARRPFRPGEVLFVELPTLVAVPDIDKSLWDTLVALNEEESFDLPAVWHLAALYSLLRLHRSKQQVLHQKWIPDPNKRPSRDVLRIVRHLNLAVNPTTYERYLQVWRYNSFGHHVESDGLVLYDKISMLAHDCASTASWHYGARDAFVLRARQHLAEGDEITISYVGDDDLFKSIDVRQEKLAGWLFKCTCSRCEAPTDITRGFRCPECGGGTVFFKTVVGKDDEESGTVASKCTMCAYQPLASVVKEYLEFEEAYIARLDETNATDLADAEDVYGEAQRVFNQHWVLFMLDGILFDSYRAAGRLNDAVFHQLKRIQYATQVNPQASYTLAWLHEEKGDCLEAARRDEQPPTRFQKNWICDSYEVALNMLLVLCGAQHDYTLSVYRKIEKLNAEVEGNQPNATE